MTFDECVYLLCLMISIALGYVFNRANGVLARQLVSTGAGVAMTMAVCGVHSAHSLITVCGTVLILKLTSVRYIHIFTFIFCFGYITVFRTVYLLGLPKPPSFANAIQLLLTLKLVGLAFEIRDSVLAKKQISDNDQTIDDRTKLSIIKIPTVWEIFCYSYCFIGIMTGPHFTYSTYSHTMNRQSSSHIPTVRSAVSRLYSVPFLAAVFLSTQYLYPTEYVRSEEFYDQDFWYRLFYMVPTFIVFRTRMYIAWTLSESVCIMAGLGAYPKTVKSRPGLGPTVAVDLSATGGEVEYDFETIHNIDVWGADTLPTMREGMRCWNMTVQWWLANYIYKRVPVKAYRTSITMLVSAYWHGIHPGYYLTFMTVPLMVWAEDAMQAAFRTKLTPKSQYIYDWLAWFFRMRAFDYLSMGFLLLQADITLKYWGSIMFIGHVCTFLFIVIGTLATKVRGGAKMDRGTINKNS